MAPEPHSWNDAPRLVRWHLGEGLIKQDTGADRCPAQASFWWLTSFRQLLRQTGLEDRPAHLGPLVLAVGCFHHQAVTSNVRPQGAEDPVHVDVGAGVEDSGELDGRGVGIGDEDGKPALGSSRYPMRPAQGSDRARRSRQGHASPCHDWAGVAKVATSTLA